MKPQKTKLDRSKVIIERDSDGWWAHYPSGWCSGNDPHCHTDREDTKREIMQRVRWAVPCTCRDCKADKVVDGLRAELEAIADGVAAAKARAMVYQADAKERLARSRGLAPDTYFDLSYADWAIVKMESDDE